MLDDAKEQPGSQEQETDRTAMFRDVEASADSLKPDEVGASGSSSASPMRRKRSERLPKRSLAEQKMENPDDYNQPATVAAENPDDEALSLRKAKDYDYFIILPDDKFKTHWDLLITV